MRIALIGNPNAGKTSLFNELTGSHQTVGNWPGVTVEHKEGVVKDHQDIQVVDLPGIYSLSPYSPEELVARDYLVHHSPDCVVNIVDGSNLERNLFLTLQLLDMHLPMVVAVNMADIMEKRGIHLDVDRLSYLLGVPVVLISAMKANGLEAMIQLCRKAGQKSVTPDNIEYDKRLESAISEVIQLMHRTMTPTAMDRWQAIQLLEADHQVKQDLATLTTEDHLEIEEIRLMTESLFHDDIVDVIAGERYALIDQMLSFALQSEAQSHRLGQKIDRVVTNRWLAFPIFALIMWGVYYLAIQTVGTWGSDWINNQLVGTYIPQLMTKWMNAIHVLPWVQDLINNGIVAGVGAVLGFLPQILILFLCLNILEDCGYMARVAFVMDRLFRKIGLSGKSFIPILIATGCGVPGVMSTRTIESKAERRSTIMLATFMPCSAKTTVIALIAGAFFPTKSWVAPVVYFISLATIVLSGLILKKSQYFQRDRSVFMMELPNYHWPYMKNVIRQTGNRCISFVKKAGTIIFASSVVLWLLSHFNWMLQLTDENHSILASIGKLLSFIFIPLGFGHWQATVSVLAGFSAKENIVNTLGILYHTPVSSDTGVELFTTLRAHYTMASAFSLLTFNVLCTPCFAAIGAMRRELGNIKQTLSTIAFQCGMAYVMTFIVYQCVLFFTTGHFGWGMIGSMVAVVALVYLVMRRPKVQMEEV